MTDFPIDTVIFNKIVEVFNQTRSYVLLLFPLAFFIRIAFGFLLLKGPESFTDILKDSLFLFLGLFFFTDILKLTLQIPYFVSRELSFGDWRNINLSEGIFTKFIKRIVDWVGILSYWISFGLYVVIISILGFLAGYILFLGTMFRAYGMLKVFFLLLFVVSLWPLLWHSINFAVFTIAVSDNALANNVIVGGASLAKVILPLWLISKTSKIPIAQSLSKVSSSTGSMALAGGSMALAGGSSAYSFVKDRAENIFRREEIEEDIEGEINITQEEADISSSDIDPSYPVKTYIEEEPEDFSIREASPEEIAQYDREILKEGDNNQITNKETEMKETLLKEGHTAVTENKENHTQSETTVEKTKELHTNNNSQTVLAANSQVITKEITEPAPQSEGQTYNESVLKSQETVKHETDQPVSETKKTSLQFNENIHKENWIEEEENNFSHKNKEEENDL